MEVELLWAQEIGAIIGEQENMNINQIVQLERAKVAIIVAAILLLPSMETTIVPRFVHSEDIGTIIFLRAFLEEPS